MVERLTAIIFIFFLLKTHSFQRRQKADIPLSMQQGAHERAVKLYGSLSKKNEAFTNYETTPSSDEIDFDRGLMQMLDQAASFWKDYCFASTVGPKVDLFLPYYTD